MMWGIHHMGYGGWGLLFTAVLWIGLIALGIWLLARLFPGVGARRHQGKRYDNYRREAEQADTAMQILQRRYARGELTKEEYETMRHDLER